MLSIGIVPPSGDFYLTSSADAVIAKHPFLCDPLQLAAKAALPKRLNTGHSGQQGLKVRSDGRIFATAGWDARLRVYSTQSMKELAVLKWHKAGCYATAFAEVEVEVEALRTAPNTTAALAPGHEQSQATGQKSLVVAPPQKRVGVVGVVARPYPQQQQQQRRRMAKYTSTHWLAGGAKDGKISLWDIY